MKKDLTRFLLLVLLALVFYIGMATHAMLASVYTEVKIANLFPNPTIRVPLNHDPAHPRPIGYYQKNNNGVYNYTPVSIDSQGQYRVSLGRTIQRSFGIAYKITIPEFRAMNSYSNWSIIPYPFLFPFALHLTIVALIRITIRLPYRNLGKHNLDLPFLWHAFISSCYAYIIMVLFQSARMLWASDGWTPFSYLDRPPYGNILLYTLLGLTVTLYIYSIIGTANLRVVRRENGRFNRCLNCKYELANLTDPCPECGSDPSEPARSKLRIRPSVFLGAAALTFFSPFILANIFDLFV